MTDAELSLLVTDDKEIRQLNRDFRAKDTATDVLSFPMATPDELVGHYAGLLGDVVISLDTAERQASDGFHRDRMGQVGEWGLESELCFLMVHGVLHLVGYDHETPQDAVEMRAKEAELLTTLGVLSTTSL